MWSYDEEDLGRVWETTWIVLPPCISLLSLALCRCQRIFPAQDILRNINTWAIHIWADKQVQHSTIHRQTLLRQQWLSQFHFIPPTPKPWSIQSCQSIRCLLDGGELVCLSLVSCTAVNPFSQSPSVVLPICRMRHKLCRLCLLTYTLRLGRI